MQAFTNQCCTSIRSWLTTHQHAWMLLHRFSLICLAIVCLFCEVHAQNRQILFEHFNQSNGLSAPVTCIAQDSIGFFWLGTTDGLNRFDGKQFTVFRNDPFNPNSIPSNIVNDLYVDQKGRIWVATNRGLCYYDFGMDRFHTVSFQDSLERIDRFRTYAVTGTNDGTIWFSSKTLVHRLDSLNQIQAYRLNTSSELVTRSLFVDDRNRIWVGTNQGIFLLDPATGMIHHNSAVTGFAKEKKFLVAAGPTVPMHKDTLLMGSWYAGLQKVFAVDTGIVVESCIDLEESDQRKHIVTGIARGDSPHEWWISTYGNGLSLFNSSTLRFSWHQHHNPSISTSLSSDYLHTVYRDATGILWVGTQEGLDKFDPLVQQFTTVSLPGSSREFSVYRLPSHISQDPDDPSILWITVSGIGIMKFNTNDQSFKLFEHNPDDPGSLPDNNVYTLYEDSRGRTWVGMRNGLCLFDREREGFSPSPIPSGTSPRGVHTIFQDANDVFWIATHSAGIYAYDEGTEMITPFNYQQESDRNLPENRVFCMTMDGRGRIWVGMQSRGLWAYDPKTQETRHFEFIKEDLNSLPDNGVFALYPDNENTLWIATENGLARMDLDDYSFRTLTVKDGLSNNAVYSIVSDRNGQLWLGTKNGLSCLNTNGWSFRNYFMNDGLPTNSIDGELYFSSDRKLYFGTRSMLSFCRPDAMRRNTHMPRVVITGYRILDDEMNSLRSEGILSPIHLTYTKNMITFHFTALNFTNPDLNQYAYRLDGFDRDWIQIGNKQSATYTNLDGGKYTFRVIAANNDNIWNRTGARANIIVHPPFWRTWWFYSLCAIAIVSLFYGYYRIRIRQVLRLQSIRQRISRDLHDDVGSTLSSIHMLSKMAIRDRKEEEKTPEVLTTISSASQQAMGLMQDIVWSINPENDRMDMILTRMRQYASETLEAADIEVKLIMDENCRQVSLPLEMRKDVYLIFKEAVNNMAKYSNATNAIIHLSKEGPILNLSISDNGNGFDQNAELNGNGLRNMLARASHMNGCINIDSTPGKGTTIQLRVPITP